MHQERTLNPNLRNQSKLITIKSNLWALEINCNQQARYPQFTTGEKSIDENTEQLFGGSIEKIKEYVPSSSSSSMEIDQIVLSIANLFGSGLAWLGYEFVCRRAIIFLSSTCTEILFLPLENVPFWCCVVYTRRRSYSVLVQDVFLFG